MATAGPDFDLGKLGALAFEAGAPTSRTGTERRNAEPADRRHSGRRPRPGADQLRRRPNPGLDLSGRQIVILGQATTISIARPTGWRSAGSSAAQVDWSLLPVGPAAGALGPAATAGSVVLTGTGMGVATLQARCTLTDASLC